MNLYDTDTRYQLCAALGCAPYANHSYNARRNAQLNLNSRTPYVTDSTLRYHHARVINSCEIVNGCFFKLVETVALDGRNTRRGSRVVVFDLTGAAIYHPSLDKCRATSKQAGKDYATWFAAFDRSRITRSCWKPARRKLPQAPHSCRPWPHSFRPQWSAAHDHRPHC